MGNPSILESAVQDESCVPKLQQARDQRPRLPRGRTSKTVPSKTKTKTKTKANREGQPRGSPMTKLIDDVRSDSYGYLVVAVLLASTFLF
jgi:hypothetical protein